ncbi:hypothetical protein KFE25_009695 [Diacronema lutheri]|uniref:Uncharacterized protein n=2 Tax=Diacronema lutheri TaxID=2081491 RepID=A0A8J5Y6E8_DIALT|nr:hypothetical protein KFE25_009695 [Diacronema lutheri]
MHDGWSDEVRARVSELLRREPVPPAEVLEHCCAILDEAARAQQPSESDASVPPLAQFRRMGLSAAAAPAAAPDVEYGSSLPLRSLQPGYPKYDARSQAFVDRYTAVAAAGPAPPPHADVRRSKIDAFASLTAAKQPQALDARIGTHVGGGYLRSQPLHQARFKRITVRRANVAAWAVLQTFVPELAHAAELTVLNFPVPKPNDTDAAGAARTSAGDVPPMPPFAEAQRVELSFVEGASRRPSYRRLTLPPEVANLLKDMDGEVFYDWHADSFTRVAAGRYGGENAEYDVNLIEKRLQAQHAEKGKRVGDRSNWRL